MIDGAFSIHDEVKWLLHRQIHHHCRRCTFQVFFSQISIRVKCEGDRDVSGVVTPLRGGGQVVLHGGQVVEPSVLLGVHEEGEVEEDGEGQVEVEREEGEVREKRTWMTMRMG